MILEKSFHVYWERVLLQNKPEVGAFTFSASLYADGDIVFGYYFLPIDITNIDDGKLTIAKIVSPCFFGLLNDSFCCELFKRCSHKNFIRRW